MKSLFILLLGALLQPALSISPDFRHLTPLDGLNDGTINDIAQDSDGQMWFATWDGVMRYDGYRIINYKPKIGDPFNIPAKQVSKLFTDSKDNLWLITRDGICRYNRDMDQFILYHLGNTPSRRYSSARIQETDNILIILHAGSLYYLDTDSILHADRFKPLHVADKHNQLPNANFRYLNMAHGEIWLTTRHMDNPETPTFSVFRARYDKESPTLHILTKAMVLQDNVTSIMPYRDHQVYIGTTGGLYHMNTLNGNYTLIDATKALNIQALSITSDNKLWMGTHNAGLACLDLHNGNFYEFTHDPLNPNTILGTHVFSLYEDFSGNLWIGYGGEGLSILNIRQKPFISYRHDPNNPSSLSTNTILCFNESPGEILIGTLYEGLIIGEFDNKKQNYMFRNVRMPENFRMQDERSSRVWKIAKENDSVFWMGTNFGLIKAIKKASGWEFEQYLADTPVSTIREIYIDDNGNIWFGSYDGLFLIPRSKRNTMEYYHYTPLENDPHSLTDLTVTAILHDQHDRFWIGTQNGGLCLLSMKYGELDLTGHQKPDLQFIRYFSRYLSNYTLNNNEINVLYEHIDGSLWIGTQGGGINILKPKDNSFRYITEEDGLAGDDVFSLLPDGNGNLWISTNKGLSRYNLFEEYFNNYTPADGIQGNVFMVNAYFRSASGKLYFGGRNGFTCFNPTAIIHNDIPPKVIVSGLKVFSKEIHIGDPINGHIILPKAISELSSVTLKHKDNSFSVRVSVIHYQNPGKNMVEYILDGFDKNWNIIPASSEYITYNNLQHGTYTLRLRGRNADNTWTEEVKELRIIIPPPWFKTWWAKLLLVIVVMLIIAGIMILVLHRQSLKHLLKIEKLEFEKLKEINEEKLRFFTNISHELRTPLSLTIAPIEDVITRNDYSEPYARKQLNLAYRNARLLIRLITQIIDFRRLNAGKLAFEPKKDDLADLIKEVAENFEVFREQKDINLLLDLPNEPIFFTFDRQKMEQVIYNLISNAFKFTPGGKSIRVTAHMQEEMNKEGAIIKGVRLAVYNDGKEIPEDQLNRIFERFHKVDQSSEGSGIGLAITKSLVELHDGKIFAESIPGEGSRFTVFFPYREGDDAVPPIDSRMDTPEQSAGLVMAETEVTTTEPSLNPDPGQELSILVVEDNEELREFLASYFEREYTVLRASNGFEGIRLAEENIPDIIVSDIVMPGPDGLKLCASIKKNMKTCHIPIILLTAKDAKEYEISGYDHGADAYVIKPFEIAVLNRQIRSLLKNRDLIRENYRSRNFVIDIASKEASKDDQFIAKLREIIVDNLTDVRFNVNHLSSLLGLSSTQVYRKVKALTGYSPVDFIKVIRLEKAAELLRSSNYSVKEACYKTGFNNASYFIKCFRKHFKVTPNVFIQNLENKPDRVYGTGN